MIYFFKEETTLKRLNRKITALFLVVALFASSKVVAREYAQRFWDVPKTYWGFEYIADLAERGVIKGYEDGSFKPEATVSRSEWAKMMVDAAGVTASDESPKFTDMQGHWANKYVNAAKQYMTGYTDGTFRPDQAATREDVAVAVVLVKGYNTQDVDYSNLVFTDNDSISNYAKAYVAVAVENDLIEGFSDGTFRGQATLTRAQAATLLYRAFQHGSADKVVGGVEKAPPLVTEEDEYREQAKPKPNKSQVTQKQESLVETDNKAESEESKNTDEPQENPEKKPYVVDTIVKANVENLYCYTVDNNGNLYYVGEGVIMRTNLNTGKTSKFIQLSDYDFTSENGVEFSDFVTLSIAWDNSKDMLILQGSYRNVEGDNSDNIGNRFVIRATEDDAEVVTNIFAGENSDLWEDKGMARILDTTSNGNFITNGDITTSDGKNIVGSLTDEQWHWILDRYYARVARNIGNSVYYVLREVGNNTNFTVCSYDFSDKQELCSFNALAYGLGNTDFVFVDKDGIINRVNYKGKVIERFTRSSIEVLDSREFDQSTVAEKIIVVDDDIIFYDTNAKAFRIIKENV